MFILGIDFVCLFAWFNSLRPINNISVKQGRVFQGWTNTRQDKFVLFKDHNTVTPLRLEPVAPRSWVKHSTTEPLRYQASSRYLYNQYLLFVINELYSMDICIDQKSIKIDLRSTVFVSGELYKNVVSHYDTDTFACKSAI